MYVAFTDKHTGNWHNPTMDVMSPSGMASKPRLSVNGGIKFLDRMFLKDSLLYKGTQANIGHIGFLYYPFG